MEKKEWIEGCKRVFTKLVKIRYGRISSSLGAEWLIDVLAIAMMQLRK